MTANSGGGTVSGSHAYTRPGSYRVTVTLTDALGSLSSDFLTLKVVNGFFRGCAYANDRADTFTLDTSSRVSCNISGYGPVQLAGSSQVNASATSIGSWISLGDSGRVDVDLLAAGKVDTGKSSTVGRNLTSGGNVTIGDSGRVSGNVRASGSVTLGKNTSIGGTITRGAPPPVIPGVTPAAFSFTAGSQAITVGKSATRTLAPGKYAGLSLGDSATLNLSAGTYTFDSISTGNSSRIVLNLANGNVVINVVKTLTFGSSTQVTVSGGAARNVLWQVQGGQVTLGKTSKSVGTFLAPNAAIDLYDSGTVTGALYGSKVHLQKTTVLTGDPAQRLYVSLYLP